MHGYFEVKPKWHHTYTADVIIRGALIVLFIILSPAQATVTYTESALNDKVMREHKTQHRSYRCQRQNKDNSSVIKPCWQNKSPGITSLIPRRPSIKTQNETTSATPNPPRQLVSGLSSFLHNTRGAFIKYLQCNTIFVNSHAFVK